MSWQSVRLGNILTESKIESVHPNPDKRITVRLNCKGVEKRPFENGVEGGTKYYVRRAGQFIYGKQNLFKGAFGLVPDELDGFESSQDIPTFDIDKSCLSEWLIVFLRQGEFYKNLESLATGTGSRRIQPLRLFEIEIPLPSLTEQRDVLIGIHTIEAKYIQITRELDQQQSHLQLLRQTILQEAVQGKLIQQNPTDEPATELLKRIKKEKENLVKEGKAKKEKELPQIGEDEIPFALPKGWVWCRLGELGEINPRNVSEDEKEVSFVPMALISSEFGINPSHEKRIWKEIKCSFTHFADNDVAVAKITPCFENSKAGIFMNLINGIGAGTTELHIFRGNVENILPDYVYLFFKSPEFLKQGEDKMTGSAGQKRVPSDYIKNCVFPLPPFPEQHRIVAKILQLQQGINDLEAHVQQSRNHIQQLLQSVLKEMFGMKSRNRNRELELENSWLISN